MSKSVSFFSICVYTHLKKGEKEMNCGWCGLAIDDIKNAWEYTHDDKSVEHTHKGECTNEFQNSRGLTHMEKDN